jgi:Cu(I)/Ag(I) efflux system membrane fusion protein
MKSMLLCTGFTLVIGFLTIGCSSSSTEITDSKSPDVESAHSDHDHGEGGADAMAKMKAELAKLSPEDAASAEKQHICPVSGEMLGTMGLPVKVDVNGNQIWICCEHCKESIQKDPEKYLAKLEK